MHRGNKCLRCGNINGVAVPSEDTPAGDASPLQFAEGDADTALFV